MRMPGQMRHASCLQTCRSFTMTYDVWSQTGPQTDGQFLNLLRYVKGAGWFDPSRDYKVTYFPFVHNICTTGFRVCTAGAVDVCAPAWAAPRRCFRPHELVFNSNIVCTMIPRRSRTAGACGVPG